MRKIRGRKQFLRIALLMIATLLMSPVWAETFIVGLYEAPPLVFNKSSIVLGIYKQIFIEISKLTSDTFVFDYGMATQIVDRFNQGKIDIEPGINPLWRHAEAVPGLYSVPFAKSTSIMVSMKPPVTKPSIKHPKPVKKMKSLKTGLVKGYQYPAPFQLNFQNKTWLPIFASSELKLIGLLQHKKIDQAVIDQLVIEFFLRAQKKSVADTYVLSEPVETQNVMIRVHPDKASAIPRFNEAIKKLIEAGTIEKIYNHYGLAD